MNKRQRTILTFYVDGTTPKGISPRSLMMASALFLERGWIEPCNDPPYYRATRSGLMEFLDT